MLEKLFVLHVSDRKPKKKLKKKSPHISDF